MDQLDQPAPSLPSGFAPGTARDNLQNGKIEMLFRFWGANGRTAEPGDGGCAHDPGVLALIEDAVASRRGVLLSAKGDLYISQLKRAADALVVSREVQLGLEGFRARHGSAPVAVSIAIDAGEDEPAASVEAEQPAAAEQEPPHELVTLLKLSKPAQILLTHDLCAQVTAIKGLPLRSFPGRFGVYEYVWTAEEKLELLQSEPQLTLAALPAAKEKNSAAAGVTKAVEARTSPAATAFPQAALDDTPAKAAPVRAAPAKMLIWGGAGLAAVAALAVIGILVLHRPAGNRAPASVPANVSPAPAVASPQPAAVEVPVAKPAGKPRAASPIHSAAKPVVREPVQEANVPAAPSADCTLGADLPRYVGLGEQARGRGDYATALRIFREVLACDPNNAGAKEGLEKALQGQQQAQ
jgi:hypothetical protein